MHRKGDGDGVKAGAPGVGPAHPLVVLLRAPSDAPTLDAEAWSRALLAARRRGVMGGLAARLEAAGRVDDLPAKVGHYVRGALLTAESNQRTLRWEARCLERALAGAADQIILLKGAAYLAAGLPMARGRRATDIDILVRRDHLGAVERALLDQGWDRVKQDAYDEHYYRAWMHELPPFRHRERGVVTDVHHTILPPTGRIRPDAARLIERSVPVDGTALRVLAPADMVIHAVVHAFQDGDLTNGLRDVVDIDGLLRHFGTGGAFWDDLVAEIPRHGVARPMFHALDTTGRVLGTPVPDRVFAALRASAPGRATRALTRALFLAATTPSDGADRPWRARLAGQALYVRSHWLRMPPLMLARHLARKAFRART